MRMLHLKEFFTYETRLPQGIGFGIFGAGHFIWITILFIGMLLLMRRYRRASKKQRRVMEMLTAVSLVSLIVLRTVYVVILKEDILYELPLHLCSMAGILCLIHCIMQWEWLGQVLYSLCLPGAVLALLFPNWSFYPAIHVITIEAFVFHMGIVLYVCMMLSSHKIVPEIKKCWKVILFLFAVAVPVYFFDRYYDVNYMFVNRPAEGSPLVWLTLIMGERGYLIGYAGMMIACVLLMDIGYRLYTAHAK